MGVATLIKSDHRAGRERLCRAEDRQSRHECFPDRENTVRGDDFNIIIKALKFKKIEMEICAQ